MGNRHDTVRHRVVQFRAMSVDLRAELMCAWVVVNGAHVPLYAPGDAPADVRGVLRDAAARGAAAALHEAPVPGVPVSPAEFAPVAGLAQPERVLERAGRQGP